VAAERGVASFAVGPERYRDSGFSQAVLRGAQYVGAASIGDRMLRAAEFAAKPGPALLYVYVPELDMAALDQDIAKAKQRGQAKRKVAT
jgi:hypothetical protein